MMSDSNIQHTQALVVKKRSLVQDIIKYKGLILIAVIPMAIYIFFHYVPMYGVIIAFFDYRFSRVSSAANLWDSPTFSVCLPTRCFSKPSETQ